MRRLLMLVTLLLAARTAFAGPDPNTLPYPLQTSLSLNHSNVFLSPQVSSPPIQFQNQGTPLGVSFTFNCSTGMSCSFVNGVMTVTSTGGSGTINSCGTTNAIALYTAATTIGCDTNTTDVSGAWTITTAGALSTPAFTMTGAPITGGTGTTTFPLAYWNCTGATAPSTWSTSGTFIGINGCSGFAGNLIDLHNNGGGSLFSLNTSGNLTIFGTMAAGAYNIGAGKVTNTNSGHLLISSTAPTIAAAGCGGSAASITVSNGTPAFTVNVGTSNTGTCTVTMPAATTNWVCSATDITTTSTTVSQTKASPGGTPTTQITLQNYTDVSGTAAWVDSDKIQVSCFGE